MRGDWLRLWGSWWKACGLAGTACGLVAILGAATATPPALASDLESLPSARLGVNLGRAPQRALPPFDVAAVVSQDRQRVARREPSRYGVARAVALRASDGAWTDLGNGASLWVVDLVSPGALGMRIHLADLRLPAGSEVAISASPGGGAGAETAPVLRLTASVPAGSERWTSTVDGETARIEYLSPPGARRELPFRVDRLQHHYRGAGTVAREKTDTCLVPAVCNVSDDRIHSVFVISLIRGDSSLMRTAVQVADKVGSRNGTWVTAPMTAGEAESANWLFYGYGCQDLGAPITRGEGLDLLINDPKLRFAVVQPQQWDLQPDNAVWATLDKKLPSKGSVVFGGLPGEGPATASVRAAPGPGCPVGDLRMQLIAGGLAGSEGSPLFGENGVLTGLIDEPIVECDPSYFCVNPAMRWSKNKVFSGLIAKGPPDDVSPAIDNCLQGGRTVPFDLLLDFGLYGGDSDWFHVDVPPQSTVAVTATGDDEQLRTKVELRIFDLCGRPPVTVATRSETDLTALYENTRSQPVRVCVQATSEPGWTAQRTYRLGARLTF